MFLSFVSWNRKWPPKYCSRRRFSMKGTNDLWTQWMKTRPKRYKSMIRIPGTSPTPLELDTIFPIYLQLVMSKIRVLRVHSSKLRISKQWRKSTQAVISHEPKKVIGTSVINFHPSRNIRIGKTIIFTTNHDRKTNGIPNQPAAYDTNAHVE